MAGLALDRAIFFSILLGCLFILGGCEKTTLNSDGLDTIEDPDERRLVKNQLEFYRKIGLNDEASRAMMYMLMLIPGKENIHDEKDQVFTIQEKKNLFLCFNLDGRLNRVYKNKKRLNRIAIDYNKAANEYNEKVEPFNRLKFESDGPPSNEDLAMDAKFEEALKVYENKYGVGFTDQQQEEFMRLSNSFEARELCKTRKLIKKYEKHKNAELLIQVF